MKTLSITRRFDAEWNEVEKPEGKPSNADEMLKRSYKMDAYNNATERSVLVPLSEYVEKIRLNNSGSPFESEQKEIDVSELTSIFTYNVLIAQPPLLSDFIPAIKEDGKWKVLEEPMKYEGWLKNPEPVWYQKKYYSQCKQYKKALAAVKYEGWECYHDVRDFIGIRFGLNYSMVFHPSGMISIAEDKEQPVKTPTTESLITELAKHKQYLILK